MINPQTIDALCEVMEKRNLRTIFYKGQNGEVIRLSRHNPSPVMPDQEQPKQEPTGFERFKAAGAEGQEAFIHKAFAGS